MGRIGLAAAVLVVGMAAAACAPQPRTITITIHYSGFDPAELRVPRDVPVTFVLVNQDPIDHEWLIGDEAFHEAHRTGTHATHGDVPAEVSVPALATVSTTVTFSTAGRYAYICHLPGHEAYGMVGVLTVEG